jgi:hypothetical protein
LDDRRGQPARQSSGLQDKTIADRFYLAKPAFASVRSAKQGFMENGQLRDYQRIR